MTVIFLLVGLSFTGFALGMLYRSTSPELKKYFLPALIYKVLAGAIMGLVYQHYYQGGDTLYLFRLASELYYSFFDDPGQFIETIIQAEGYAGLKEPRSLFFVKLIGVLNLFSLNSYWVATLYLAIISFMAAWVLVMEIIKAYNLPVFIPILAFLLFPSIAFWTSGIQKETLSISSMYLLVWALIPMFRGENANLLRLITAGMSLGVLYNLKYYHAAALMAFVLPLIAYVKIKPKVKSPMLLGLASVLTLILSFVIVSQMHHNLNLSRVLEVIVENNYDIVSISDPDQVAVFYDLRPEVMSLIINSPVALWSGLFQPLPWEAWDVLSFILSMENTVLFFLALSCLVRWKSWINAVSPEVLAIICYVLVLATFMALSTPNYGTLSRYKVAYLPWLVFVISTIIYEFLPANVNSSD